MVRDEDALKLRCFHCWHCTRLILPDDREPDPEVCPFCGADAPTVYELTRDYPKETDP